MRRTGNRGEKRIEAKRGIEEKKDQCENGIEAKKDRCEKEIEAKGDRGSIIEAQETTICKNAHSAAARFANWRKARGVRRL